MHFNKLDKYLSFQQKEDKTQFYRTTNPIFSLLVIFNSDQKLLKKSRKLLCRFYSAITYLQTTKSEGDRGGNLRQSKRVRKRGKERK